MTRVVVFHRDYGCETGCCGHAIKIDGVEAERSFDFDHPYPNESPREFAERLITQKLGAEHVADLDWEACIVIDD